MSENDECFDSIPLIDVTLPPLIQHSFNLFFGVVCVLYDIRVHNDREDCYIIDEATVQVVINGIFEWVGEEFGRYLSPGILEVSFVSEDEIQAVNGEYRSKPYITDVLSFYYLSEYLSCLPEVVVSESNASAFDQIIGELLICPVQAKRQAGDFGNDFSSEIGRLIVHGTLHIAGFDHENVSKAAEQEMIDAENLLFDRYNSLFKNFFVGGRVNE